MSTKIIFRTFIQHEFSPKTSLWVFEKNQFTFPIVFYKIDYYDQSTDNVSKLLVKIYHLDGILYELVYNWREGQTFFIEKCSQKWFNEETTTKEGFAKI